MERHPCRVVGASEVHPSAAHQNSEPLPCPVVDPSVVHPSAVRPSAVRPSAVHQTLEALPSPAERPSLVLQMLELQRLAELAPELHEPTEISSDCRPARPRKNLPRRHHQHHLEPSVVALHIHPCHLATWAEEAQRHPDSSSAEMGIRRSSLVVLEAHTHLHRLHHQPLEAAVLPLRRPRTRRTYCRACPCP